MCWNVVPKTFRKMFRCLLHLRYLWRLNPEVQLIFAACYSTIIVVIILPSPSLPYCHPVSSTFKNVKHIDLIFHLIFSFSSNSPLHFSLIKAWLVFLPTLPSVIFPQNLSIYFSRSVSLPTLPSFSPSSTIRSSAFLLLRVQSLDSECVYIYSVLPFPNKKI